MEEIVNFLDISIADGGGRLCASSSSSTKIENFLAEERGLEVGIL